MGRPRPFDVPPYRPPFKHAPSEGEGGDGRAGAIASTTAGAAVGEEHYQPCKVVVMGLPADIDEFTLVAYFGNFGTVKSWVVKFKPTDVYAFIEFDSPQAPARAMMMAPHMIKGTLVSEFWIDIMTLTFLVRHFWC